MPIATTPSEEKPARSPRPGQVSNRPGFKKTKMGWIPEEWKVTQLADCGKWKSGGTPSRSNSEYWNGEIPWVSAKSFSFYIDSAEEFVTEEGAKAGSRLVPKNTVLMLVRGMGLAKEFPVGLTQCSVAFNQDVKAIYPTDRVDARFLTYALKGQESRVMHLADSTSHGTLRLQTSALKSLMLPLPPLPEQRRIAGVLATWDRALAQTDDLIAAKERRKRAFMQQLLTGKTRLPEFADQKPARSPRPGQVSPPEDWKLVRIDEIADVNRDSLSTNTDEDYEFKYVDLESVNKGRVEVPEEKICFGEAPSRAKRILLPGDLIMSTVRPNLLGFAIADFDTTDVICSTGFALISPHDSSDAQFIYQSLYSDAIMRQVHGLVTGSNYPAINNSEVKKLKIPYPSERQERKQIAAILSTCDDEIETLRRERAALERQKKGMMQKLLTGRVRVPAEREAPSQAAA